MSETALLLIRHAASSWNALGRWQGHGDPPLSDRGRAQANALARELAREAINILVSSDLRRAAETAAILGEVRGLRPELKPRLRELDVGDWEGLTRDQIERTAGDTLQRFDEKRGAGTICRENLLANGVCMRAVGDTIICAPPFVLSHAEADEMIEATWKALDLTQQALSAT